MTQTKNGILGALFRTDLKQANQTCHIPFFVLERSSTSAAHPIVSHGSGAKSLQTLFIASAPQPQYLSQAFARQPGTSDGYVTGVLPLIVSWPRLVCTLRPLTFVYHVRAALACVLYSFLLRRFTRAMLVHDAPARSCLLCACTSRVRFMADSTLAYST
jgi:hypothetical protein